ncbi:19069_t:CDS:2 [Gigaspora margarita]|uniref:19069_t:CDS:1 n=1 Tax=Gigaspora margarita TaxID=4874 RepID=A0ABN7WB10_GIGMA|nr:19069_t:CDS:2 [Gigaspora margarita]
MTPTRPQPIGTKEHSVSYARDRISGSFLQSNTNLLTDPELVIYINLTLLIKIFKELTIVAQALREHYFFYSIPEKWIEIPKRTVEITEKTKLTDSIERTNEIIKKNDPLSDITFLITEQKLILMAIELLAHLFVFDYISDSYFEDTSYPPPS